MTDHANEWIPQLGPLSGRHFKWGLNGDTGEFTIWEVSGPGDGYPSHDTYLFTAWGRSVKHGSDLVGMAHVEEKTVRMIPLGTRFVPAEAVAWAASAFPVHELRTPE